MLRLEAVARDSFHVSVNAASEAIKRAGGWITGHSLLSDAMAVLNFEIRGDRLHHLLHELGTFGLKTAPPPERVDPGKDVAGRLTILFSQGSGDLRREVPPFQ